MSDRYLFQLIQGMGNILQKAIAYAWFHQVYGVPIDCIYVQRSEYDTDSKTWLFAQYIDRVCGGKMFLYKQHGALPVCYDDYTGLIHLRQRMIPIGIPVVYQPGFPPNGNEFDYYNECINIGDENMKLATVTGLCNKYLPFDTSKWNRPREYDVIICAGGDGDPKTWDKRKYGMWPEVIKKLQARHLSVAMVGREMCVPDDVHNLTGLPIKETLEYINACRVFAANDSGLYHAANFIGKRNVAAFTCTDYNRTFNGNFHSPYCIPVFPGLDCAPCMNSWGWHKRAYMCNDFKCTRYSPDKIVAAILRQGIKT
jgi:hypothetical protein